MNKTITPTKPKSNPNPSSDQNLEMVIDVERFKTQASSTLESISHSIELGLHRFLVSGDDAYRDMQTLITFDNNRRMVVSCRRSSLQFMGSLVLCSCVIVLGFRLLVQIGLTIRSRIMGFGHDSVVIRRDRSLGGKQVVVGIGNKKSMNEGARVLDNPLLRPSWETAAKCLESGSKNMVRAGKRLPKWWPVLIPSSTSMIDKEENQRMANRLIRAIMDNRMTGQDIFKGDIIQLRRICRTSGSRVSIDTTNARDSIYRASVNFVLSTCSSATSNSTSVEIDGEDARQFISGLADNLGLNNLRAARIVSAAVAARTRSSILQAWALEMQGKHSEAMEELSKICLIHRIFPPEEASPEMEMVARGLEKHLKLEQREFLMNMFLGVCGEDSRKIAAEALGLVFSPQDTCIQ